MLESFTRTITDGILRVLLSQIVHKLLSADLRLLLLVAVTVVVLVAGVEVTVLLVAGVVVTIEEPRVTVIDWDKTTCKLNIDVS